MFRVSVLFGWYIILALYGACKSAADETAVGFSFKEYQYKDSPKNDMTFREFQSACEQSSTCSQLSGVLKTRCIRECVSPSCYRELYQSDPRCCKKKNPVSPRPKLVIVLRTERPRRCSISI